MKRKHRTFKSLQFLPLVAAVAALDSGLFNAATFAPPSFSNVAFAAADADGRVLATSPRLLRQNNAPEIADELSRLFPDASSAERK